MRYCAWACFWSGIWRSPGDVGVHSKYDVESFWTGTGISVVYFFSTRCADAHIQYSRKPWNCRRHRPRNVRWRSQDPASPAPGCLPGKTWCSEEIDPGVGFPCHIIRLLIHFFKMTGSGWYLSEITLSQNAFSPFCQPGPKALLKNPPSRSKTFRHPLWWFRVRTNTREWIRFLRFLICHTRVWSFFFSPWKAWRDLRKKDKPGSPTSWHIASFKAFYPISPVHTLRWLVFQVVFFMSFVLFMVKLPSAMSGKQSHSRLIDQSIPLCL